MEFYLLYSEAFVITKERSPAGHAFSEMLMGTVSGRDFRRMGQLS